MTVLAKLVAELRELGIAEIQYSGDGMVRMIKLAPPPPPPPQELTSADLEALLNPLAKKETEEDVMNWHVGGLGHQNTDGTPVVPPLVGEDPLG